MCGILLTTREKIKPTILDSIKHRGIESSKESLDGVTLCHHRLPIQTLDGDEWKQPIEISDGVFLMFNGEIFNYDSALFSSDTEYLCSLFANFKGGKGVATLLGMAIALHPMAALTCVLIFTVILLSTNYVSLGSIISGLTFPLVLFLPMYHSNDMVLKGFGFVVFVMLLFTHKQNILRLFNGTENKIYLIKK